MIKTPQFTTLGDVADVNADRFGDRAAFQDDHRTVSFDMMAKRAAALRAGLRNLGLKKNDRVAFLCKNRIECLEIFLAAELGVIIVPINWRLTAEEIAFVLGNCAPRVLIVEDAYLDIANAVLRKGVSVEHKFVAGVLNALDNNDWRAYEALFATPTASQSAPSKPAPSKPAPTDAACIVYTSGTTGKPKGAVLSHEALLSSAHRVAHDMLELSDVDVTLAVMPLFHVGGMWFHCFPSFLVGAKTILQSVFRPDAALSTIVEHKVTNVHMAPTMVADILDRQQTGDAAKSLKTIYYAASPMPIATLTKAMAMFPDTDFYQSYGSTESGPVCWLGPADHRDSIESRAEKLQSCGRAFDGVDVKLIGSDGADLPLGAVGEIAVRSKSTLSEYWRNADATRSTRIDHWVATGDLGRFDSEGYLYIVDRKKDMIISGGENVYPQEVENVLSEAPGVNAVAVIGVPDERWVERVVACVVKTDDTVISEQMIIDYAKKNMSGYKCPKEVIFLDALPKNAAGKILKRRLKEAYPFHDQALSKS